MANAITAEAPRASPISLADWKEALRSANGQRERVGVIVRMVERLLSPAEPPAPGYIAKLGQRLGWDRLMTEIWLAAARPPNGNPLAYIDASTRRSRATSAGAEAPGKADDGYWDGLAAQSTRLAIGGNGQKGGST